MLRIRVIAIGDRMPAWVSSACAEYVKRVGQGCALEFVEVTASRRGKGGDISRVLRAEGERLLAAAAMGARIIALDRSGRRISTETLATKLRSWLAEGQPVDLLVGGPEGLAPACLDAAREVWSLSDLTLAHPVVRVVLAEQVYRAWSIARGLPYHRGS